MSVSILVNGSPTKEFFPKKGLRQGDPLALFLFLIVAEGLVGVSTMTEEKNLIDSLEVGRDKVEVNMLQYAEGTLTTRKTRITYIKFVVTKEYLTTTPNKFFSIIMIFIILIIINNIKNIDNINIILII